MDHLDSNDGIWRVRVAIPPKRRPEFGGRRYLVESTGVRDTGLTSRRKAQSVGASIVARFLRQLDRPAIRPAHLRHSDPGRRGVTWLTPPKIFDALGIEFTIDVASPGAAGAPWIPAARHFTEADDGLSQKWNGCIWLNPPFGVRQGMQDWLDRFVAHGDGVLCLPANTYTGWHQWLLSRVELVLYVAGYVRFISSKTRKPTTSPTFGTALFSIGETGCRGLRNAQRNGLGALVAPA